MLDCRVRHIPSPETKTILSLLPTTLSHPAAWRSPLADPTFLCSPHWVLTEPALGSPQGTPGKTLRIFRCGRIRGRLHVGI